MADLQSALIGFMGALVGSATSLVGVYLNQRAQERRSEREFTRSQIAARLARQEEAFKIYRQSTIAVDARKLSYEELHSTSLSVRFAFGQYYGDKAFEALSATKEIPASEEHVLDSVRAAGKGVVVSNAMAGTIEETRRELGAPIPEGTAAYARELKNWHKQWEAMKSILPRSPKPSRVTSKNEGGSESQDNQDDDPASRVEAVQDGKK